MKLTDLEIGKVAKVLGLEGSTELQQRMREIGIRPGVEVRLQNKIPMGGYVVEAGQSFFALRPEEADHLVVEAT